MSFAERFKAQRVAGLDLSHYCRVASGCSVGATLKHMGESDQNCALVMQQSRLVGIFTDRDVLTKVADSPDCWADPIDSVMTRAPLTVTATATAMQVLALMSKHRFRNVPVLNGGDAVIGNASYFGLMHFADALLRDGHGKARDAPAAEGASSIAGLAGPMSREPLTVAPGASLAECVASMRENDVGVLLVVDDGGGIVGVFSERDVLTKVAGKLDRLDGQTVGDFMTSDVLRLTPRDSIATALEHMTRRRIRRLPLVGDGGRATGVVSFRDIAAYIEAGGSA